MRMDHRKCITDALEAVELDSVDFDSYVVFQPDGVENTFDNKIISRCLPTYTTRVVRGIDDLSRYQDLGVVQVVSNRSNAPNSLYRSSFDSFTESDDLFRFLAAKNTNDSVKIDVHC